MAKQIIKIEIADKYFIGIPLLFDYFYLLETYYVNLFYKKWNRWSSVSIHFY